MSGVLSIGKLVDPNYYLERVADRIEAYYSLRKEAPGYWLGQGTTALSLSGQVDGGDLKAVLEAHHPRTGEPLGVGRNRKVKAFDLCFRAPKSVSVLAGVGDPDTVETIHACHERAVAAAVSYLERQATSTRRGHNGVKTLRGAGLVCAAFRHRTSRAGDPHLHTHVLVANMTLGPDGRWTTLDAGLLYHHAKTAGCLYEAQLRVELTRELGVEWEPVHNGIADVSGIPKPVLRAFSKRRAEIEARMDERGVSSPRAAQIATLDTRRRKTHDVEAADLRTRWRAEAVDHGLEPAAYAATLHRVAEPTSLTGEREEGLAVALSEPAGLTHQHSAFDRRDVLRGLCERLPEGAEVTDLEAMADRYLDRAEVVDLEDPSRAASLRLDGQSVPVDTGGMRYSTRDMLAVEERMISAAVGRRDEGCALVGEESLSAALAARPSLSAEQAFLVARLTTSGNGVDVVAAAAGTGKTFSLDAAREAWIGSGYRVIGCALAARAAAELEAGSGIPAWTVARLRGELDDPRRGGLDGRTVLVCDEAAMIGSRTLARLLSHAQTAGAKVVLVGDARQLPEIEAGGGFSALGQRVGALTLSENRRQREAWERDALARLRAGKTDDALGLYHAHGRVVARHTADQVREAMVADWWAARAAGESAVMLAARRADVDDLNARARVRMGLAGQVSGPELVVDERPYQAGDRIMTLRNQHRLGLRNGTVGTVVGVDPEVREMSIRTDRGVVLPVPQTYLDAGYVTHAYATTVYKAQGMTTDRAMLLGNDDLFLEMGYVGLSRGRAANHLYVVANPDRSEEERGTRLAAEQPYDDVVRALGESRAKRLAVDSMASRPPTLTELFAERDFLRRTLAAAGPDPAADLKALRAERRQLAHQMRAAEARLSRAETNTTRWKRLRRRPDPETIYAERDLATRTDRVSVIDEHLQSAEAQVAARSRFMKAHAADRLRVDRIERNIEGCLARRLSDVGRRLPQYLTELIGEIPESPRDRSAWWSAVRSVETYRARAGVTQEATALGAYPEDVGLRLDWNDVHAQLLRTGRDLRPVGRSVNLAQPHVEPDQGLDLGL